MHDEFPAQVNAAKLSDEPTRFLENISETPSESDIQTIKAKLITLYSDVFDRSGTLKPMTGEPMKIHVRPNAKPFALSSARQIPYGLRDQVKKKIEVVCKNGIIERIGDISTEWCHPMVVVRKPNGDIRICTDFTKLNKYCARPHHPQRTPKDAVDAVRPSDRYFSLVDAQSGYWQMEIEKESQLLTCFICPEGRLKYLRASMGLVPTGD